MSSPSTIDKTISPQPTPYEIKNNKMLPIPNRVKGNTILPSPHKIKDTYVFSNVSSNKSSTDLSPKKYSTSTNLKILIMVEVCSILLLSYLCFRKQINYQINDKKDEYDLPLYIKQAIENNKTEPRYRRTISHDKLYNVA
jgi:hypothetical protein